MSEEMTTIQNSGSSEYVSYLLDLMIQNLTGMGVATEATRKPLANRKSSLVTEVVVGLGVSATWDLIKFSVKALNASRRPAAGDELMLNGKRYEIREIENNRPGRADDKPDRDLK
jgi:hypothetical protein